MIQLLLEDVSGRPYPEYMKTAVLTPLGMSRSTYKQPLPRDKADQAASGHRIDGEAVNGRWHVYPELAAAGLWTTPSDLCRFAIELQKSAAGESDKIISRETAGKMLTAGTGMASTANSALVLPLSGIALPSPLQPASAASIAPSLSLSRPSVQTLGP